MPYLNQENFHKLKNILKLEESFRQFPYLDTKNKLTIGYGINLSDVGIYRNEADFILGNRMMMTEKELAEKYPNYLNLDFIRQCVLLDLGFNIGIAGLLHFHEMLAALNAKNYAGAANAMRNSLWYKEVGHRAEFLSNLMEKGEGL